MSFSLKSSYEVFKVAPIMKTGVQWSWINQLIPAHSREAISLLCKTSAGPCGHH